MRLPKHFVVYLGERLSVSEAARRAGLDAMTLHHRLKTMSVEKAMTLPVGFRVLEARKRRGEAEAAAEKKMAAAEKKIPPVLVIKPGSKPLYVGPCSRCFKKAAYWPNLTCSGCTSLMESA